MYLNGLPFMHRSNPGGASQAFTVRWLSVSITPLRFKFVLQKTLVKGVHKYAYITLCDREMGTGTSLGPPEGRILPTYWFSNNIASLESVTRNSKSSTSMTRFQGTSAIVGEFRPQLHILHDVSCGTYSTMKWDTSIFFQES